MKSKGDTYFGECTLPHSPKVSLEQGIGVMAGEVLRINICGIFELSASYQR